MKFASFLLGWVLVLALPTTLPAGLYNPCELDEGPFILDFSNPSTGKGFRETLLKVRSFAMDKVAADSPFRQRYLLMADALSTDNSRLTPQEKLSGSEYFLRRRQPLKAKFLLLSLARQPGDNFLILSNLATACQQLAEDKQGTEKASEYQQAIDYVNEALRIWPKTWEQLSEGQRRFLQNMYWTEETFVRCRTAEEYYLKLLRGRQREALQGKVIETVDALFPLAQDAGPAICYLANQGKFEPGKLAAAEKAKLPEQSVDRALQVVQQLVFWLPFDNRLYWQLGELYNARGQPQDLRAARKIFDELVWDRKVQFKEVKDRRAVLNELAIPEETSGPALTENFLEKKLQKAEEESSKPIDWKNPGRGRGDRFHPGLFRPVAIARNPPAKTKQVKRKKEKGKRKKGRRTEGNYYSEFFPFYFFLIEIRQ